MWLIWMEDTAKTPTNTVLDELLKGGFENDIITTIYGPSGAGKTNICVVAAVAVAKQGGKVIFIDTEGGFSAERVRQICGNETEKILDRIFFFKPTDFKEQQEVFEKIKEINEKRNTAIIVVEHNLKSLLEITDRAYVLDKGKVVSEGEGKSFLQNDTLEKVFTGRI